MSGPSGDVDVDIGEGSDQTIPTRHAYSNLSLLMEFLFKVYQVSYFVHFMHYSSLVVNNVCV